MQTDLTLSIGGLPPMSARGCVQELIAIPQGEFRRTINGDLIFVGNKEHKYRSVVTCDDKNAMATEGLKVGAEVLVGCIQTLCQKIPMLVTSIVLEREPVKGSLYIVGENNLEIEKFFYNEREVSLEAQNKEAFVFYSPVLKMRVVSFTLKTDEWKMKSSWKLELEEI